MKDTEKHLFWSISPEDISVILESDLSSGLSLEEARNRLDDWGHNSFGQAKRFSKFKVLWGQFKSPLIFILVLAGLTTLFLNKWMDATIIFLAIGVNTALGFYQENKAENTLSELRSYIQERSRVIRGGKEMEIDAGEIVPGDIIRLIHGGRVPADARVFKTNSLRVDEAILTGESLPVSKKIEVISEAALTIERKNMVFGGTLITEGTGMAIVTSTGRETEIGKIASLVLETEREETPLQKAVKKLAWIIAIGVSVLVVGIFALGLYRGEPLFDMFLVSVAVAINAIPEALPVSLTVVLAVGVEQLAKKKGVMRNLVAAETLGSTTVIITDKTGTLTEAKMQLIDVISYENLLSDSHKKGITEPLKHLSAQQKDILFLSAINTNVLVENPHDEPNNWEINGNALESNIVRYSAIHQVYSYNEDRKRFHMLLPFNSKNKFSVSEGIVDLHSDILGEKSGNVQVVLGAPDILLKKSVMDKSEYLSILQKIEQLSEEGKRLLAVAGKFTEPSLDSEFTPEDFKDLRFIGMLAFYDPIRKSVPHAVKKIKKHGIRMVIATGDLKGTAVAVARGLGWTIEDNEVLTGEEIRQMEDEELMEALDMVKVYARVAPEDKLRIAQLFQKKGEIVAMTGDGVNDAPSLKAVDIGIAVGSGSDVAKEVADLVLLDDNFDIIVSAIEEGKRILQNIRKTFVYLMSNSLDGVILIGGSLLAGLSLPLTAIQIIWVNFFTGSLPAIAFAFDKDENLVTEDSETNRKILDSEVKFLSLGIGTLSSTLLFVLYWSLMRMDIDQSVGKTFLFACFSSYILFVAFSLRSLRRPIFSYNIFSNKFLVFGVAIGLILLSATIYIPFLQNIFQTTSLPLSWVSLIGVWVIINIAIVEFAKWIFYSKKFS